MGARMLGVRRLGAWLIGGAMWVLAAGAQAAISVAVPPHGFADPPVDAAEERATAWATAVAGRTQQVFSTADDDGYFETLAVIEVDGALPRGLDLDPASALLDEFGAALGQTEPPTSVDVELDEDGNPGPITGRFDGEDETWFVAVASSGPNHALVILAVQSDEAAIYRNAFDTVVAELQGIAPPLPPFALVRWRIGTACGWVAFVAIAWMVLARLRDDDTVHERARWAAGTSAIAAVVVFVIAWFALGRSEEALGLAGLGRAWVAAEASLLGIIAAVVALGAGAIRGAQVRPIESAPSAGAFRRHAPAPIRPVTAPLELVPARVDGPSTLAPAEEAGPAAKEGPTENTFRGVPPPPPPPKPKPKPKPSSP